MHLQQSRFTKIFPPLHFTSAHPRLVSSLAASFPYGMPEEQTIIAVQEKLWGHLNMDSLNRQYAFRLLGGVEQSPFAFSYNYGGHQFGHWAGQLGDGRAIVLGDVLDQEGCFQELQIKGAGLTPFSRQGDGYAVMRSSVREFLASEAMAVLGVPTTRALTLIQTGVDVFRDRFYDGRGQFEPGAIVCRVAPTFLRFGHFEWLAATQNQSLFLPLVRFLLQNFYEVSDLGENNDSVRLLKSVAERTGLMVANWQVIGFVHGVLNTDNMSMLGLTLDYGPFAFLDEYQLDFTSNTSDLPGRRYAFGQQPSIVGWNLQQLARAFMALGAPGDDLADQVLDWYRLALSEGLYTLSLARLGFADPLVTVNVSIPDVANIAKNFWDVLYRYPINHNSFLRAIGECWRGGQDLEAEHVFPPLRAVPGALTPWSEWLKTFRAVVTQTLGLSLMTFGDGLCRRNPKFLPRNYVLQQAIDGLAEGDARILHTLLRMSLDPYADWKEQ